LQKEKAKQEKEKAKEAEEAELDNLAMEVEAAEETNGMHEH
jgi:hypothetical protein